MVAPEKVPQKACRVSGLWLLLPGNSAYQEASLRQRLVPLAVQPLGVSATSCLHLWKLLHRPSERTSALDWGSSGSDVLIPTSRNKSWFWMLGVGKS